MMIMEMGMIRIMEMIKTTMEMRMISGKMLVTTTMTETIKMKMMEMIKMMIQTFKQNNPSKLNSCLTNTDFFVKYSL